MSEATVKATKAPKEVKVPKEKVKIHIPTILNMLASGKTRPEIGEILGLNKRQLSLAFKHPLLKGRKTHFTRGEGAKKIAFEFVEDLDETTEVAVADTNEEVIPVVETAQEVVTEPTPVVEAQENVTVQEEDTSIGGW